MDVGKHVKQIRGMSVVLGLLILLGVVAGCLGAGGDGGLEPVAEANTMTNKSRELSTVDSGAITRIDEIAAQADGLVGESFSAQIAGNFDLAKEKALAAKSSLSELQQTINDADPPISEEERRDLEEFIDYEQRWSTLLYKTATIDEMRPSIAVAMNAGEEWDFLIPKLELLARGYRGNAQDWMDFASYLESKGEFKARYGITDENVNILYELADTTFELGQALEDLADTYREENPGYVPVSERAIPTPPQGRPNELNLITQELAGFFDGFDKDQDKKLSIGEAQEFFYWVEDNIQYRYDNEGEKRPVVGTLVGDGRTGSDYRQTPLETYSERAGDCEDMATLEQGFYRYYGIDAYVVGVNAMEPDVLDHAAAIVWIADKTDLFRNTLGDLVYYEFDESAKDTYGGPIKPGVYMLVDNSYSGVFGYLSGGLEPGTFKVHCAIPLEKGYRDWSDVVGRCGVPMD